MKEMAKRPQTDNMSIFYTIYRRLGIIRYHLSRNELVIVISSGFLLLLIGTFVYAWLEEWSLLDSLYVTIITMTTVGYGDLSPKTVYGRLFAIFFTLIAIGIGGYAISVVAALIIEKQATKLERTLRKRKMEKIDILAQHMIICGGDFVGTRIALEYKFMHIPFILIEADEERLKQALLLLIPEYFQSKKEMLADIKKIDLSKYEDRTVSELAEIAKTLYLLDDPTDDHVLWQAGIDRAAGLVTVLSDDRDNLSVVIGARVLADRSENPNLRIMARAEQLRYVRKMYFSGANEVRMSAAIGAEMALHLAHPEIGRWWSSRLDEGAGRAQFAQVDVGAERPLWVGKTVADIHVAEGLLLMALKRDGRFLSPPLPATTLQKDDIVIVFGQL
ncbi:MAG: hypothetical protein GY796_14225 [Chloroflexi bacterium]|nr:hypothetical protein [Chloroflexota bacterium]